MMTTDNPCNISGGSIEIDGEDVPYIITNQQKRDEESYSQFIDRLVESIPKGELPKDSNPLPLENEDECRDK